MFKSRKIFTLCGSLLGLAGCASYEATMLTVLPVETSTQSRINTQVLFSSKLFDKADSEKFLGRDVIAEGYVPVQMTIRNQSSDPMYLSPNNFNIPLPTINEVANKVHTSTAARVAGWGIPGLVVWPLLGAAIFDGIKSKEANAALDADYAAKSIKELTIQPQSSFNGIVFVPNTVSVADVQMFLVNQTTNEKIICPLMEGSK